MGLDPDFMEVLNGMATLVALWVMFFFGRYIWIEWRESRERWRVAGAFAIFVAFLAQTMLRGTVWVQRHLENNGGGLPWETLAPILAAGAGILIIGCLCIIRVFAPAGTGLLWAAAALATSLMVPALMNAF